jgi:hypothetical protein
LGIQPDATVQALLLLDTLIVIAWYAHLTLQVAVTSQQQFELADRMHEAANRPCVVIEWQHVPPPSREVPSGWTYVAKNIGPGLAVSSVLIEDFDAKEPTAIWHLGAIESGGSVQLPDKLVRELTDEGRSPIANAKRHVVVAEPLKRESWVLSTNLVEGSQRLSHRVETVTLPKELQRRIHRVTLDEALHLNWIEIQRLRHQSDEDKAE